jgi:hypothetical protein
MSHVSTHRPDASLRVCRYCRYHGGELNGGVWCVLNETVCAGGIGCAMFVREPGSDDDLTERYPKAP